MSLEGRKLYTVEEFRTQVLGGKVGRNTIYAAIRTGALAHIAIGRRVLITEEAGAAWLNSLTKAAAI